MNEKLVGSLAITLSALFAGAAVYINVAEQPARLALGDSSLLTQWQTSYPLALRMQSSLAIAAAVAGTWAWWISGDRRWLFGAGLILVNWPYTLTVLAAVNTELMALRAESAGPESRALVERWGGLHAVRSALGIVATIMFVWVLNRRAK